MALKGHTKIELTNTETGEVRTVEDDNMITNALGMFVENTGCFNFNTFSIDNIIEISNPMLYHSRGLMLFSDPIDENPSIVYPPSGNVMTGQASTNAYTGIQTTIGSYNINESGEVENGYRYVWDFNNSQANGRINCACLTSQSGGLMGAGSDIKPSDGTLTNLYSFYPSDSRYNSRDYYKKIGGIVASKITGIMGLTACVYVDLEQNCFYSFNKVPYSPEKNEQYAMLKEKKIVLNKCRLPVNNYSLFDVKPQENIKVIETIEFNFPEEFINKYSSFFSKYTGTSSYYTLCCMNEYKKHLYLYIDTSTTSSRGYLSPGTEFLILDLDIENKSISCFKATNTTGQYITLPYNNFSNQVYITDKYIFMHGDNGRVYKLSRENNADVVELTFVNGNVATIENFNEGGYFWVELGGKFFIVKCEASSYNSIYMIDPELNTIQYTPCDGRTFPGLYQVSSGVWKSIGPVPVSRMYGTKYGPLYVACPHNGANGMTGTKYMYPFIFPNYLLTINNLPNEVVKTSAETMKVTYTITDIANYNE